MKGKHKKFEADLYTQFDGPAKEALSHHLELIGHTVTVPPENYGPDLYSYWVNRKCYHEVEVSRLWKTGRFPFLTGSIPERKIRLMSKVGDCQLFIWMLRMDLKAAVVYDGNVCFQDEHLVEVPNIKIESGEYFYRPSINLGKEFNLLCL